jgi:hypothetical protein
MKEIYLLQNKLGHRMALRVGSSQYLTDFVSVDEVIKYFKQDPKGVELRQRKNLNVILQLADKSDCKNLEDRLPSIDFKKAFVSYDLPYEKARVRYQVGRLKG